MAAFSKKKIAPCLWFDSRLEEAVNFYVSLFGGKVHDTSYYPEGAPMPKGTVLTMTFSLQDEEFMALNGGPHFKFNEAVSFVVKCKDQAEVDKYWSALTADGGQESQCGWLKDKYGLSWQIAPEALLTYTTGKDAGRAKRAMQAMMTMKKIDIATIEKAAAG
jgi:predicted 3-demethylubiquinone-9 3-methyltransferase (glyoxalase superfamily)